MSSKIFSKLYLILWHFRIIEAPETTSNPKTACPNEDNSSGNFWIDYLDTGDDYFKNLSLEMNIDTSKYSYDVNDSFSNIDMPCDMTEKVVEATSKNELQVNIKIKYPNEVDYEPKKSDEIESIKAVDQKIIGHEIEVKDACLPGGNGMKEDIKKGLETHYQKMKFATENFPLPETLQFLEETQPESNKENSSIEGLNTEIKDCLSSLKITEGIGSNSQIFRPEREETTTLGNF